MTPPDFKGPIEEYCALKGKYGYQLHWTEPKSLEIATQRISTLTSHAKAMKSNFCY
jgi:hypothetical protein